MSVLAQILARERRERRPLVFVDGSLGGQKLASRTRFDLDEAERFLLKRNQIDIAGTTRRPIVPGDDRKAKLSQVEVGFILASRSKGEMRCDFGSTSEKRGEAVEGTDSGAKQHCCGFVIPNRLSLAARNPYGSPYCLNLDRDSSPQNQRFGMTSD